MVQEDKTVGTTADGIVVVRNSIKARDTGLEDPFATYFITDEGRQLAQMAQAVDHVYEDYSIARYLYTTSRLMNQKDKFSQMLFLGSGFDCRAINTHLFQTGTITIFEVDIPSKLQQKTKILTKNGHTIPKWVRHIGANLQDLEFPKHLRKKGLKANAPLFILSEGLFFFVRPETIATILNPKHLGLADGSRILFDCWTNDRVNTLNARVEKHIGRSLFHSFPYPTEMNELKKKLLDLGYREVSIKSMDEIALECYKRSIPDEYPASWLMVEAVI